MYKNLSVDLTNIKMLMYLITESRCLWGTGGVWVGGAGSFNPPGTDYSKPVCKMYIDSFHQRMAIVFRSDSDCSLFLLKFGGDYPFIPGESRDF
jgi:hypothetical protein